ncbi:MAG TPA: hypothetical protein VFY44_06635 [Thermoleophilaceae bacterium]|nr:hypothetical protein [Thermoleophilaceae bacterium]
MIRKITTALVLATALAAAAGPATADAANPRAGMKNAFFKVTVDGVQTTTWKTDHPGSGGCDGALQGNGTEKVRFTSRPTTVRAVTLKGLNAPLLTTPKSIVDVKLRLHGKVTRAGVLDAAPGGQCGGAGGGSIPRDCGAKSFRGVKLPLSYGLGTRGKDNLDLRAEPIQDPFLNCPSGGSAFPTLVGTREGGPMPAALPRSELFDRKLGKIIVIARGQESETVGEHTYLTKTRWVVTFERKVNRR